MIGRGGPSLQGRPPPERRTRRGMTEDGIALRARALAEALAAGGYARLRVRDGETEIEVRRSGRAGAVPTPAPSSTEASAAADSPAPRAPDVLTSDAVGTVRFGRPPVAEGTELDADREIAFVEVLGIRNAVRSRGAGRVASVFVNDGQPVEYGQPLFAIER